jgi:gluconate kinase
VPADAFLISGIPGSGKTTVSRALAMRFDHGVHLEGDAIALLVVSGNVGTNGTEEGDRQLTIRRRNMRMLSESFVGDGFTTVIDDVVVSPGVLDGYRELPFSFRFVQLAPSLDVVERRDAARDKQWFHVFKHLDAQMRSWPEPRPGLWLDTSDMDVDQTVQAILDRADEASI